jgi:hypothetical protein
MLAMGSNPQLITPSSDEPIQGVIQFTGQNSEATAVAMLPNAPRLFESETVAARRCSEPKQSGRRIVRQMGSSAIRRCQAATASCCSLSRCCSFNTRLPQ